MIEFNKPPFIGTELEYIRQAAEENNKLCGDGPFTKKCSAWMQDNFNVKPMRFLRHPAPMHWKWQLTCLRFSRATK